METTNELPVSTETEDSPPMPTAETIVYKLRSGYDLHFKLEVTAGEVLISTLLAFLTITILVMFLHKLILGRGKR